MRTNITAAMMILVCITVLSSGFGAEPYREQTLLFPGESHSFKDVTVEWRISGEDRATSPPNPYPGQLIATGPAAGEVRYAVSEILVTSQPDGTTELNNAYLFLDGILFQMKGVPLQDAATGETMTGISQIRISANDSEIRIEVDAAFRRGEFLVSAWTPVTLNNYRLRIPGEQKTLPDGSRYYMLSVDDMEAGIHEEIPIAKGSQRKIGRFFLQISPYYPEFEHTKTIRVTYQADFDFSVKGRGAVVTEWDHQSYRYEPINAFFDDISRKYEFTVEWRDQEGHPGSADEIRQYEINPPNLSRQGRSDQYWYGTMSEILTIFNERNDLVRIPGASQNEKIIHFEWDSPTQLIAQVINYDKIAQIKDDQNEIAQKNEEILKKFEEEYQTETKAYAMDRISADTALDLIKSELKTWYLQQGKRTKGLTIVNEPGNPPHLFEVLETRVESAIADKNINTLILTAIPATIKLFEERLSKIQNVIQKSDQAPAGKPCRLVLTLLEGNKLDRGDKFSLTKSDGTSVEYDPELAQRYGFSREDLDAFGIKTLGRVGAGMVTLLPERGANGRASVALGPVYSAELEFEDMREPYLVLRGRLLQSVTQPQPTPEPSTIRGVERLPQILPIEDRERVLMQNTLYLQPGQVEMLGVTNLREALILVVEWKVEK